MSVSVMLVTILVAWCVHAGAAGAAADYVVNKATGHGYKLMYQAQTWDRAMETCKENGAKLAVPKAQEEFLFIQRLVRGMHYPSVVGSQYKLVVWLGITNIEDYTLWKNVDGENIEDTGFHTWAGEYNGEGFSNDPSEPHCAGLDARNLGLRDFWCHRQQPFICEIRV